MKEVYLNQCIHFCNLILLVLILILVVITYSSRLCFNRLVSALRSKHTTRFIFCVRSWSLLLVSTFPISSCSRITPFMIRLASFCLISLLQSTINNSIIAFNKKYYLADICMKANWQKSSGTWWQIIMRKSTNPSPFSKNMPKNGWALFILYLPTFIESSPNILPFKISIM